MKLSNSQKTRAARFVLILSVAWLANLTAAAQQVRTYLDVGSPYLSPREAEMDSYRKLQPDKDLSLDIALGLMVEREVAGRFVNRLGVELGYGRSNIQNGVFRLDYLRLQLPFEYAYEWPVNEHFALTPSLGVGLEWFIHQEDGLRDRVRAGDVMWPEAYDDRFRRVHPAALAGLSLRFRAGHEVGISYEQQLTPLYKDSFNHWPLYDQMKRSRFRNVALRFGLRL